MSTAIFAALKKAFLAVLGFVSELSFVVLDLNLFETPQRVPNSTFFGLVFSTSSPWPSVYLFFVRIAAAPTFQYKTYHIKIIDNISTDWGVSHSHLNYPKLQQNFS